jgi:uncharacterized protein YdeI (YjbR/CyaY-like superfamily)
MGRKDPRVDAYIARSAGFAKPILKHLRAVVHQACPEVEETLKWSAPHFLYEGMLCGMSAFKEHAAFGFWKGALILDGNGRNAEAMGQFGRITELSDLPSKKVMTRYIRKAMALNEAGVKSPTRPGKPKKPLAVPADFQAALRKNRKAMAAYDGFSPSQRREYLEWITEAKRDETRQRRIGTAVEWLAEGKTRNWKYQDC